MKGTAANDETLDNEASDNEVSKGRARFLFVVPPLVGHTNPTVSLAAALVDAGHDVAWVAHQEVVGRLLPEGARVFPAGSDLSDAVATLNVRAAALRGAAALRFLWEEFFRPLAIDMIPAVDAAVQQWQPDIVIADQQAIAGAIVAQQRGLTWVTSATTSAELVDPFSGIPKVGEWVREQISELQRANGVSPTGADPRFSNDGLIAYTSPLLADPERVFPKHWWFVGPLFQNRPAPAGTFDWAFLDGSPTVLVTMGTANTEAASRFLHRVIEALASTARRAIVVGDPATVSEVPDHVLVTPWIPQVDLLASVDAVVCHGGHNTVCEALAHGLPLVVAPIRDDQPVIANQVAVAGAGIRLKFSRARSADIAGAIDLVLTDPTYRRAAGAVRQSFLDCGGAARAVVELEQLLNPGESSNVVPGRSEPTKETPWQ